MLVFRVVGWGVVEGNWGRVVLMNRFSDSIYTLQRDLKVGVSKGFHHDMIESERSDCRIITRRDSFIAYPTGGNAVGPCISGNLVPFL